MRDIRHEVIAIRSQPEFNISDWWLTFYLTAPQERLESLARRLAKLGAVNLADAEGGFLYPKLPVRSEPDLVLDLVSRVRALAEEERVETLSVDVDTSPDVERSKFKELARFDPDSG